MRDTCWSGEPQEGGAKGGCESNVSKGPRFKNFHKNKSWTKTGEQQEPQTSPGIWQRWLSKHLLSPGTRNNTGADVLLECVCGGAKIKKWTICQPFIGAKPPHSSRLVKVSFHCGVFQSLGLYKVLWNVRLNSGVNFGDGWLCQESTSVLYLIESNGIFKQKWKKKV